MFVYEARRNTFRESRNARMSAMEKSKSVGNTLLNPPKLIQASLGLGNLEWNAEWVVKGQIFLEGHRIWQKNLP